MLVCTHVGFLNVGKAYSESVMSFRGKEGSHTANLIPLTEMFRGYDFST